MAIPPIHHCSLIIHHFLDDVITAKDDRGYDGTRLVCLGLLPLGPDPVHSRPLHRTRSSFAATTGELYLIWQRTATSGRKVNGRQNRYSGSYMIRGRSARASSKKPIAPLDFMLSEAPVCRLPFAEFTSTRFCREGQAEIRRARKLDT
jgi:hypothetical protein